MGVVICRVFLYAIWRHLIARIALVIFVTQAIDAIFSYLVESKVFHPK